MTNRMIYFAVTYDAEEKINNKTYILRKIYRGRIFKNKNKAKKFMEKNKKSLLGRNARIRELNG